MTGSSAHVLVVEDNVLVTSATRILLEDAGFRVTTAARLADAYSIVRSDPPDAVLLDLRLPDGDGLSLLSRLREEDVPLPVVAALTGRDEPEIRARCMRAGCAAVFVKPVDARALGPKVRSLLEDSAGRR